MRIFISQVFPPPLPTLITRFLIHFSCLTVLNLCFCDKRVRVVVSEMMSLLFWAFLESKKHRNIKGNGQWFDSLNYVFEKRWNSYSFRLTEMSPRMFVS